MKKEGAGRRDAVALVTLSGGGFAAVRWLQPPWVLANVILLGVPLVYLWTSSQRVRSKVVPKFVFRLRALRVVVFDYLCVNATARGRGRRGWGFGGREASRLRRSSRRFCSYRLSSRSMSASLPTTLTASFDPQPANS